MVILVKFVILVELVNLVILVILMIQMNLVNLVNLVKLVKLVNLVKRSDVTLEEDGRTTECEDIVRILFTEFAIMMLLIKAKL